MKRILIGSVIIFGVWLFVSQITQAQGTLYLSNVDQTSAGSVVVGSDSWLASGFATGNNAGGYVLNSIQLGMTDASGNPSGFTIMIYSAVRQGEFFPGSSLGTLNGSTDPTIGGVFIYTPVSNLSLSPSTAYFIVLTAGTAVANGAYDWSVANSNYSPSGGWFAPVFNATLDNYQSTDGSNWTFNHSGNFQFGVTATPVPEPSELGLFGLGVLGFLWHHRKTKRFGTG